jgi:hypothetical protein
MKDDSPLCVICSYQNFEGFDGVSSGQLACEKPSFSFGNVSSLSHGCAVWFWIKYGIPLLWIREIVVLISLDKSLTREQEDDSSWAGPAPERLRAHRFARLVGHLKQLQRSPRAPDKTT